MRSSDVISCPVTATSCEIQPCRSSNLQKTPVLGLSQRLPGDFRSNESFPGHLQSVKSRDVISDVTATSCDLQPCRSSNVAKTPVFTFNSHFQVTSVQMTSLLGHFRSPKSRDVFSCHVTATSCELQPCRSFTYTLPSSFSRSLNSMLKL